MYDAWAAYDDTASTWLLGKTQAGYDCDYTPPNLPRDLQLAREQAVSFAAYRIVRHRFQNSPGADFVAQLADDTRAELGYDIGDTNTAYELGSPAALGNHIAECYIAYGLQDGSNEANNYDPLVYAVVNPPIEPELPGNPNIVDLDRWQQITLTLSIDQSGNVVDGTQEFVGPRMGCCASVFADRGRNEHLPARRLRLSRLLRSRCASGARRAAVSRVQVGPLTRGCLVRTSGSGERARRRRRRYLAGQPRQHSELSGDLR